MPLTKTELSNPNRSFSCKGAKSGKEKHGKITGKAAAKYFAKQDSRSEVVAGASGNWMFPYETIDRSTPQVVWLLRSKRAS